MKSITRRDINTFEYSIQLLILRVGKLTFLRLQSENCTFLIFTHICFQIFSSVKLPDFDFFLLVSLLSFAIFICTYVHTYIVVLHSICNRFNFTPVILFVYHIFKQNYIVCCLISSQVPCFLISSRFLGKTELLLFGHICLSVCYSHFT